MNINVSNVKKYYGDNLVLNIDKLNIKTKKITGITGPNGCGKSTLLNIIARFDENYLGDVTYEGKEMDKEIYSDITMITQKPYLFKRSVFENVSYPLKVRKVDKNEIKEKVEDILTKLDISNLRDKQADKLSGGESQKVSLARGLVFKPKLMLLDEPTSNIDPESIKVMEKQILEYNEKENGTVVIVTHNLEQAERLCDEVYYLEKGEVVNKKIIKGRG